MFSLITKSSIPKKKVKRCQGNIFMEWVKQSGKEAKLNCNLSVLVRKANYMKWYIFKQPKLCSRLNLFTSSTSLLRAEHLLLMGISHSSSVPHCLNVYSWAMGTPSFSFLHSIRVLFNIKTTVFS